MAGKFGHVKVRRSEMLPHGELAKLMGYTGPDDVLVITVAEDDDPISSSPTTKASDSTSKRLSDAPLVPQATQAAEGKPTEGRSVPAIEDRHYTLSAAVKLAAQHEMVLTEDGGLFTVTSVWGTQPYVSLAEAVAAIRQYGRWREAMQTIVKEQRR